MQESDKSTLKIAVIGGGIAGIMSAYLLERDHNVTIFEAADYLGGHANSVKIDNGIEPAFNLDTAFLVFNNRAYPLFIKFLKQLNIFHQVERSPMNFSFSDYDKNLFFGVGLGLNGFFQQKENKYNLTFYKMFKELLHFRKKAYNDLMSNSIGRVTLGEYLKDYSTLFKENMIAPTAVAVWSLPVDNIWDFPAETYLRFQDNHNYLNGMKFITSNWYTFKNGSCEYVQAFWDNFLGKVNLNSPVKKVIRHSDKVEITKSDGSIEIFDKVIFATHASTTLKLIDNPSELEKKLLGVWNYHSSKATLHTDESLLYPDKKLWASWNIKLKEKQAVVTYYLNKVQNLKSKTDYFLTLGDAEKIDPEKVIKTFTYEHPIYSFESIDTQSQLDKLNGYFNSYFCGSYFGFGFHEDAVRSAVKVAWKFGIEF